MANPQAIESKRIPRIVFIALLLDILSFTIILPLLPRTLETYRSREANDATSLLGQTLSHVTTLREWITARSGDRASRFLLQGDRADLVLLGGMLGSLYSLLQCIIAPLIGRAADRFGRRRTLMFCMLGNVIWTVIWVFSSSFGGFLVARVIAGLSEGNVQISNTVIADVTRASGRSRGMALVGIAFAVGFTLGPSLGAYFASMPLESAKQGEDFAPFASAAVVSLCLLLTESVYLYCKLPETLNYNVSSAVDKDQKPKVGEKENGGTNNAACRIQAVLRNLNLIHFVYLFFFSGMEYTLTFFAHDKLGFTNMQQGKLLGFIGIVSTLLQGGYVRRIKGKKDVDRRLVMQGVFGCSIGLLCVAMCARAVSTKSSGSAEWWIWAGALGFAVASATVVNCMNSLVSLVGQSAGDLAASDTGRKLGNFRSAGQIGRALGPIFACSMYWLLGAEVCYLIGTVAVAMVGIVFSRAIPSLASLGFNKEPKEKTA